MESVFVGIIVLIIGGVLFIIFTKGRSKDEEESETYIRRSEPQQQPTYDSRPSQSHNRQFTLAELKTCESGKYSWDETGCVFEINSDGSVTIVGYFDLAELHINPVQKVYDSLINAGLFDMLPRLCSFQAFNHTKGETDQFVMAYNDEILSLPSCPYTINGIHEVSFSYSSFEGAGKSVIAFNISKTRQGILILMPSNEKEYILALGAKACVERAFGNEVRVTMSSPAVMGAFGIAIARASDKSSKISFAFGVGEDYMCCNLLADDGIYEVQKLLHNSIIQSTETFTALHHIAKGCMAQSLIREGRVMNYLLIDMLPYTMSFLQKENGRVIKIYDCISEPTSIPTRQGDKDLNIDTTKTLSFLIGSNELIEDVMAQCNAPNGKIGAFIEIDSDMGVMIKIASDVNEYKINIGELVG